MIEVKNLTKRYGQHLAVDNVTFKVNNGEILGFLGPNGAGKSTTMNIITGYLSATEGSVSIEGHDILDEPELAKKQIGFLPELPPLYMEMTVSEYLNFVSQIKKVDKAKSKANINKIMEVVKITDHRDRLVKNLSKGYKQRVGLAQALIGTPTTLVLDEPTVGLDPNQIKEMRTTIKDLGKEHTIILSSHILPEVQAVCERIIIIDKGKLVAEGTPESLQKKVSGGTKLQLRLAGSEVRVVRAIKGVEGVSNVNVLDSLEPNTVEVQVESRGDFDIRRGIFHAMSENAIPILLMENVGLTLEQIFQSLTVDSRED